MGKEIEHDDLWEKELNREVERLETAYKIFAVKYNGGNPIGLIRDSEKEEIKLFAAISLSQIELPMCKNRTGGGGTLLLR